MRSTSSVLLFLLAFGSGFAVMAIEIAGARVMAPAYGLSAVPWTAVIGVILGALAAGNHIGGRLVDRGVPALPWILAAAGVTALLPVLLAGLPFMAQDALGFLPGALVSAAVLFAPPVLALGMVVPYLVRLGTRSVTTVGRWTGNVSAAATLGSILGTFATGFLLLPLLPLPLLLAATGSALLLMAAGAALLLRQAPAPFPLVLLALAVGAVGLGGWRTAEGVLHREETIYGSIQVTEGPWEDGRTVRQLWQNGASSSAEYVDTGEPAHPYAAASLELVEALPRPSEAVLVLGGGALTLPVALARQDPERRVDVVELDPAVTRLAGEYFAYGRIGGVRGSDAPPETVRGSGAPAAATGTASDHIHVVHADARRFLRSTDRRYDVIHMDVFDNLVTVPWTLVTVEALEGVRARLRPGGVVMANILTPTDGPGAEFLRRLLATFETVFPEVRAWPVQEDRDPTATVNVLLVAGAEPGPLPSWDRPEVAVEPVGPPLTDSHAPVEALQARVFLEGLRWR